MMKKILFSVVAAFPLTLTSAAYAQSPPSNDDKAPPPPLVGSLLRGGVQ